MPSPPFGSPFRPRRPAASLCLTTTRHAVWPGSPSESVGMGRVGRKALSGEISQAPRTASAEELQAARWSVVSDPLLGRRSCRWVNQLSTDPPGQVDPESPGSQNLPARSIEVTHPPRSFPGRRNRRTKSNGPAALAHPRIDAFVVWHGSLGQASSTPRPTPWHNPGQIGWVRINNRRKRARAPELRRMTKLPGWSIGLRQNNTRPTSFLPLGGSPSVALAG